MDGCVADHGGEKGQHVPIGVTVVRPFACRVASARFDTQEPPKRETNLRLTRFRPPPHVFSSLGAAGAYKRQAFPPAPGPANLSRLGRSGLAVFARTACARTLVLAPLPHGDLPAYLTLPYYYFFPPSRRITLTHTPWAVQTATPA